MTRQRKNPHPLNILLTNGRFPTTIDLARQLHLLSHNVFVVDAMHYHVCKFSTAIKKSYQVPAPHYDSDGFIAGVEQVINDAKIDIIIPMHEEILYLAASGKSLIIDRLRAPDWSTLLAMHNKWTFSQFLQQQGLQGPKASLCRSISDVKTVLKFAPGSTDKSWAVKPVFGRASQNVYHLDGSSEIPKELEESISAMNPYIAQEWVTGRRYCSYSVFRNGAVSVFGLYPVEDTIDGSSCVYFRSVSCVEIETFVAKMATALSHVPCAQFAFDFTETKEYGVVALECNPRATSGIHLFSGTTVLAESLTGGGSIFTAIPPVGTRRQLAPGMMMWKRDQRGVKAYARHMMRLMGSKDVMFSWWDLMPSLMQPFLLTSYYEICRERKMKLPDMFQDDLVWYPDKGDLEVGGQNTGGRWEDKDENWREESVMDIGTNGTHKSVPTVLNKA
jgi:hypothetical protein